MTSRLDSTSSYGTAAKIYGYQGSNPTIDDFVLWMYSRAIEDFASGTPGEFETSGLISTACATTFAPKT